MSVKNTLGDNMGYLDTIDRPIEIGSKIVSYGYENR